MQGFFDVMPFGVSFAAGVLTFFLPCALPMVPAYLSYISGFSLEEIRKNKEINLKRMFFTSLLFVFGFSFVFVLFGALLGDFLGTILRSNKIKIFAGAVIIAFGVHMTRMIFVNFLNFSAQINIRSSGFFSPFLLGVSFALGWSPCVGPVLGSIIFLSSYSSKAYFFMIAYALGLGIPFMFMALLTAKIFVFFERVKKHFRMVEIITGVLLILIGVKFIFEGVNFG